MAAFGPDKEICARVLGAFLSARKGYGRQRQEQRAG